MNNLNHIAIIMDGNGRWANEKNRPRVWGHIRGANRVSSIVEAASKLSLKSLTLYTFSTENWSRPRDEVTTLFKILRKFLKNEKENLIKNNIKLSVIGNYRILDTSVVKLIDEIIDVTSSNTGLQLSLAINYGGRTEIIDAVNDFLKTEHKNDITEEDISKHLYNPSVSEVDLVIRTAGDKRISNFLLWEISYAELYFTDVKWPDFTKEQFIEIINQASKRERRFGSAVEKKKTQSTISESLQ